MSDERIIWGAASLLGLVVFGVIVLAITDCRADQRCVDDGGHLERVNCHIVHTQWCTTQDWGNDMVTTTCYPSTYEDCDKRCVGLPSERNP